MPWFAAHAVMYFKHKAGSQDRFWVWENVFVLEAADHAEAEARAEALARREEGDTEGSLRSDGQPAVEIFAGIRKVAAVLHGTEKDVLTSGDEVTHSKFILKSEDEVRALAAGAEVTLQYVD